MQCKQKPLTARTQTLFMMLHGSLSVPRFPVASLDWWYTSAGDLLPIHDSSPGGFCPAQRPNEDLCIERECHTIQTRAFYCWAETLWQQIKWGAVTSHQMLLWWHEDLISSLSTLVLCETSSALFSSHLVIQWFSSSIYLMTSHQCTFLSSLFHELWKWICHRMWCNLSVVWTVMARKPCFRHRYLHFCSNILFSQSVKIMCLQKWSKETK